MCSTFSTLFSTVPSTSKSLIAAECGTGRVTVLDVADAGLLPGGGAPEPRVEAMVRAFGKDAGEGVAVAPEDVEVLVRLHVRFEA